MADFQTVIEKATNKKEQAYHVKTNDEYFKTIGKCECELVTIRFYYL